MVKNKPISALDILRRKRSVNKQSVNKRSFTPKIEADDEYKHHCGSQTIYGLTYMYGNDFIPGDNVCPSWFKD